MFEFSTVAAAYCAIVGAIFLGLWLYHDRRDHQRFERERRRTTFHCIKCDRLYTSAEGTDLAPCPRCGHENARLRY